MIIREWHGRDKSVLMEQEEEGGPFIITRELRFDDPDMLAQEDRFWFKHREGAEDLFDVFAQEYPGDDEDEE